MKTYFLNGKFVKENQAKIKVNDLGILRGYGVFDYLRTYNRIPFHLEDHLKRFFNSAKILNLKIPYSKKELEDIIGKLIKKNKDLKELSFRIILTGGETNDGKTSQKPSFSIIVNSPHSYSDDIYKKGIKIITLNYIREFPVAKSLNYALAIANWPKVLDKKAGEILYTSEGKVYEASTSNFFVIKNEVLFTPAEKVLEGITKKIILKLAKKNKIPVKETDLFLEDVLKAEESFISATDKKVMPVVKIDNHKIGNGKPGKITKKLMEIFEEYSQNYS